MVDFGTALSVAQTLFAALECSLLKEAYSVSNYESELERLKETVTTIQSVLADAGKKATLSQADMNYIQKLKDAVYDADDLFDKFITIAARKQNDDLSDKAKIDNIVAGVPPLFDRLKVVMNPNIIDNLIDQEDVLWKIRRIMQSQYYLNVPRVPAEIITRDTVTMKHTEVEELKAEVFEMIKRCESVIPRPTLYDLLSGDGNIFRGPFDVLYVWNIYEDHLEEELFAARPRWSDDDNSD